MPGRSLALRFLSGPFQGGLMPLDRAVLLVGRQPGLDLVLADELVSRRHARFFFEEGTFVLEDLGSTNGTFLNGTRVSRSRVAAGDRILLGASLVKVVPHNAVPKVPEKPSEPGPRSAPSQSAMEGRLEEVPLRELLQFLSSARRTGALTLRNAAHTAEVHFEGGRLTSCVIDGATAVSTRKSFQRLLSFESGHFEVNSTTAAPGGPAPLPEPMELLVAEGLRQAQELARFRERLPSCFAAGSVSPEGGNLDEEDRALVALALTLPSLGQVLDATPLSDLDAAKRLAALLTQGCLEPGSEAG
ncbi:MAG TPA: FHA domain-containing protein [Anaeromyxobacteraceae bacterium]|nr:FHA domain-containing protein [Anaeromyxobacteraceae bacterium]